MYVHAQFIVDPLLAASAADNAGVTSYLVARCGLEQVRDELQHVAPSVTGPELLPEDLQGQRCSSPGGTK